MSEGQSRCLVERLFALGDRQELVVVLATFDWDFSDFGPVRLMRGDAAYVLHYHASGNLEGRATLALRAPSDCGYSVDGVRRAIAAERGLTWIERDQSEEGGASRPDTGGTTGK